jgi:UDP-N-acetylmuramoyl-L-alanyl-D-glutamate--2,6-diaminopimelate ligase
VKFDIGVLTNITHEALEFHGTFEAYTEAKAQLFHMLASAPGRGAIAPTAVLNAGDPSFDRLAAIPVSRLTTYSVSGPADYRATAIRHGPAGLSFVAHTPVGEVEMESPLLGAYNVANILAAMAAAAVLGCGPAAWREGAGRVTAIPGRMEVVDAGQDFLAIVDFAHTPNGLRHALATAHELTAPAGRVIAVFGCAGRRDPGKRDMMGRVAGKLADAVFVTAEDPRTEDLAVLLADVAAGVVAAGGVEGETLWRVADRGAAIRRAVATARQGDVVIVCGKGHEQSMAFGDVEYAWDDRAALRAALTGQPYGALPTAAE